MGRRFQNVSAPSGKNLEPSVAALVGVVGYITAQTQPLIQPLPATATTAEIIAKINELLARLQGT